LATKRNDTAKPGSEREASRARDNGARDSGKLQLLAEELSVAKQVRETGRVRVATETHEREALVDEDLARECIEIEKVPVGRRIDRVPDVRREGDITIVPVVEEVLHVERQLMLKEEVRIRRVRTTERHQEKVTLRHQEAVVTRDDRSGAGAAAERLEISKDRKAKNPKE
jgi:uncharacterized protein (TIGR02271 family)